VCFPPNLALLNNCDRTLPEKVEVHLPISYSGSSQRSENVGNTTQSIQYHDV
jgi:hypothetical protein